MNIFLKKSEIEKCDIELSEYDFYTLILKRKCNGQNRVPFPRPKGCLRHPARAVVGGGVAMKHNNQMGFPFSARRRRHFGDF